MPRLVEDESQFADAAPKEANAARFVDPSEVAGLTPERALEESPLSLIERAQLGWARTPVEQEKLLRTKYKDVQVARTPDGGAGWVVKGEDGKWAQVDPAFHWTKSATGASVPEWDNHNFKHIAGSLAQYAGEYGLRASAATAAGAAALPSGMAAGAAGGPWGAAIGGAATALSAAGLAAAGAEAVDLGSRQLLMSEGTPGRTPYGTPEEVQTQLLASAIFGMEDFAIGQGIGRGVGAVTRKFGSALKTATNTEETKLAARKILNMMGADERLTEARLANPMRTAHYDEMVSRGFEGSTLKKAPIDVAEDAAIKSLETDMKRVLRAEQAEFAALKNMPEVQKLEIDLTKPKLGPDGVVAEPAPAFRAIDELKEGKYFLSNEKINPDKVLNASDRKALLFIQRFASRAHKLDYATARSELQNISNLLNSATSLSDKNIGRVLRELKRDMRQEIIDGLGEKAGAKYVEITQKYGGVRDIHDELVATADSSKALTLGKRLLSEDRNAAKELLTGLSEAGVADDVIQNYLQIQAARQSASWFTKGKLIKAVPKPNPNALASVVGTVGGHAGQLRQGVAGSDMVRGALPYTSKVLNFMKSLPPEKFKALMSNPELFDQLAGTAAGAYIAERETQDELLRQAGAQ